MHEIQSELEVREELLNALVPRQIAKQIQTEENRQVCVLGTCVSQPRTGGADSVGGWVCCSWPRRTQTRQYFSFTCQTLAKSCPPTAQGPPSSGSHQSTNNSTRRCRRCLGAPVS